MSESRRAPQDIPRPTMEDVAKLANVSRALVSLVFREPHKVSETRRNRVLSAAEEIGFAPNYYARKLATVDTRSIGVLVSDIRNPFFMGVVSGIQMATEGSRYELLFGLSHNSPHQDLKTIKQFQQHRVSGIIVVTAALDMDPLARELRNLPTVVSGIDATSHHITSVMNNELEGAHLGCQHLYELGHRQVIYIGGGRGTKVDLRAKAFHQASRAFPEMSLHFLDGDFDEGSGIRAAKKILNMSPRPTAVVAANDLSALGALAVFRESGLEVPRQISVLGYDDTYVSALRLASLSTIAQSGESRGITSFQALSEELSGKAMSGRVVSLSPSLVLRKTTAAAATL